MGTAKAKTFGLFPHTCGRPDPPDRLHTTTTSPKRGHSPGRAVAVHSLDMQSVNNGNVSHGPGLNAGRHTTRAGPASFQPGRHTQFTRCGDKRAQEPIVPGDVSSGRGNHAEVLDAFTQNLPPSPHKKRRARSWGPYRMVRAPAVCKSTFIAFLKVLG